MMRLLIHIGFFIDIAIFKVINNVPSSIGKVILVILSS